MHQDEDRIMFDMLESLAFLVYFVANFLVAVAYLTGDVYFEPRLDHFLHRCGTPGRISLPVCIALLMIGSPLVVLYTVKVLWHYIIEPCSLGCGKDVVECPVCLRSRSECLQCVKLLCDHVVCRTCIQLMCYTEPANARCPLCRQHVYKRGLHFGNTLIVL
ncbi:18.2 kDa BRCA1-like protein [Spodoptera frugiperda ascovirus 1a]|uniref:18.2 kDa BRCA1-like protein n=1 Tax=Spodoptera frugiperda ascovirus 1a TaxID=113370 RepID=Q0E504_SFAVA|nr:18.2 kDa BRCA1-like protein [Spodoptera frugiperda ascovirus 1a]CAL44697.1 18.2 kDa BRCA1-like protein [Spodoptera frugiperda ascovirus 1a]